MKNRPGVLLLRVALVWGGFAVLRADATLPTGTPEYHQQAFPEIGLGGMTAFVKQGEGLILDARDEKAYARGHIPGARLLPADPPVVFNSVYGEMKQTLEADKSRPIVVYCTNRWCPLSETLYKRLIALGYRKVVVFRAGFDGWRQSGLPVEK